MQLPSIGQSLELVGAAVKLGPIDHLLPEHHADAAVIVVGTRSTDGFLARFRGSLTNRLTGRVGCPVVSIPLAAAPTSAAA